MSQAIRPLEAMQLLDAAGLKAVETSKEPLKTLQELIGTHHQLIVEEMEEAQ